MLEPSLLWSDAVKSPWGRLDPARAAVVRAQLRAMRAAGDSLLAEEEETTHRKALLTRFAEADRVDSVNRYLQRWPWRYF